jgi:hypothetical protein
VAASKSPLNPLQRAIVTALRADATLAGLLASALNVTPTVPAVLDQVLGGQAYPYVRIGESNSTPDNDHSGFGRNVTQTLHIWTKTRGNIAGQDIAARITELLDHQITALAVTGHRVVSIRSEFDQALTDPDPEIRHHVLRFRIITAQLP